MKKLLSILLVLLLSFGALAEHMGAPYEFRESHVTIARIASGVTEIAEGAYYYCKELKTLEVPATVTKIGDYAFDHCENLTELTIPNSVREIGECAFNYCMRIASLDLGNGVKTLGSYAFSCCFSLRQATIPQSVTSIGDYAFYNCRALDTLYIYSSVQSIGASALEGCPRLTVYTPVTSFAAAYCTQNGIKWVAIEEPEKTENSIDLPASVETDSKTKVCNHAWVEIDSKQENQWKNPRLAWKAHPRHELSATCRLCGETQTFTSYNPNCCLCSGAHIWRKQPTSVISATAMHPSHTVHCLYCNSANDTNFDARCTECGAKEVLWYCELAQLAYNTDQYSNTPAPLPENGVRIDIQREETTVSKNEIVTPDCLIYTTTDSNGNLSVAFAFEGSQGNFYQILYKKNGDHKAMEGWNDWWLTDYAVGKDERGIHRGFDETTKAFIRYLKENICIPIPESFEYQFSKGDLARNADGQLCVSWDGLLNYAHTHITQTEIRITGHSLGGALAQVFTYDLLRDYNFTKDQLTTVTFASPVPFSDEAIKSTLYDNLKVFNYINIRDFVPKYGVANATNSTLSLFETIWNEISNAAGFTESSFPGGFVVAGSNLGHNIYMQGDGKNTMIDEHSLSTYAELLNGFFGSGNVRCYSVDTRDSALWDVTRLSMSLDELKARLHIY